MKKKAGVIAGALALTLAGTAEAQQEISHGYIAACREAKDAQAVAWHTIHNGGSVDEAVGRIMREIEPKFLTASSVRGAAEIAEKDVEYYGYDYPEFEREKVLINGYIECLEHMILNVIPHN